jgi:hypothetical protein
MNENAIGRQIFTYPLIFKLLYSFGNVIVSVLLVLYNLPLIVYLDKNNILIIPIVVSLFLIYYINRYYLSLYKILPYLIEADDEKITCSKFFLSSKEIIIYYEDIESLSGGIFNNKITGLMKICDGKNSVCIGFYRKLNNSNRLATIILSKVKRHLYDEVLEKILAKQKRDKN